LFFSTEENEIYFTFHQEMSQNKDQVNRQDKRKDHSDFIKAIKAIKSKESQESKRILEEIENIFKLLIDHCGKKIKLILIVDNYYEILSLINTRTKDVDKEEKTFATDLNDLFRRLKGSLTIILASCNNETQQSTQIECNDVYYNDFTLSLKGIRHYAHCIRTHSNYTKLPNISQKQAEAIQQLTNGIYLEVIMFFKCFKNENFNFEEGVNQYKVANKYNSTQKVIDFFEKRIEIVGINDLLILKKKKIFREKFYSLLLSMKFGTSVSLESLEYIDKFLMFFKREGRKEDGQFKIFARNQVAYQVLLEYYHDVIIQMEVQEFIDLIASLQKINANPSMKGLIFEKFLIKSLSNAGSIKIENVTLRGQNVK
jgi:regulator of extracellular matrix RemA (YlzA/DUF370 family)